MTKQEFLDRSRKIHGYKYEYLNLSDKVLSTDYLDLRYNGLAYRQKVSKHLIGRCPEKNTPKKTQEEFLKQCEETWGNKYDYSLTKYDGALKKIKIIYDGVIFEQDAVSHISGQAPEKTLTKENFIRKSKLKHGNKYDYSLVNYISGDKAVMIGYNGIFYLQKPYQHLRSCPENLKLAIRKTTKKFVTESNLIHDFKYIYDKSDYKKNQIKVTITCPIHGDFDQTPLSHIQGCGCPHCHESHGEKEISKILKKLNIHFDRQKKFPGCRNICELPFDFYIPSAGTLIEFDGKQHFQPIDHFGGIQAYETLKINDKIKSDYCEENYINLVRIRYDQIEDIEKILWENLKTFIKKPKLS